VKKALKNFREEERKKWVSNYIPVTMDELMTQFEKNMKRSKVKEQIKRSKSLLYQPRLVMVADKDI
jgi:hypothetical protein